MKKQVLFGTTNQEKLDLFRQLLEPLPVEILSPGDLNIHIDVKEDGKSPEENAEKKARAYFAASNMPTLAIDAGLHIQKFPDEKQPGVYVRRIYGNDQDIPDKVVLDYYTGELEKVGGESVGTWNVSIVLMISTNKIFAQSYSLETVFTSKASDISIPGAPLSSLMTDTATGKYYSEMTYRERPDAKWYFEFVKQHIEEL